MDILIKVSGDLEDKEKFYDWLASINHPQDKLFILCGGGTLITKTLKERGVSFKFGPAGREIESATGRSFAHMSLVKQSSLVEEKLQERMIKATVFVPVVEVGCKLCHMNGDSYATALYPNFDKIYVVTLKGRIKNIPAGLDKIEVVYL